MLNLMTLVERICHLTNHPLFHAQSELPAWEPLTAELEITIAKKKAFMQHAVEFSNAAQVYIAYCQFITDAGDCTDSQLVMLAFLKTRMTQEERLRVHKFMNGVGVLEFAEPGDNSDPIKEYKAP